MIEPEGDAPVVIDLIGGPFDGQTHEIIDVPELGIPNRIGITDEYKMSLHWYEVRPTEDVADYVGYELIEGSN